MLNTVLLQEMITQGYVQCNKHPEHNLYIYNYTQNTQFEKVWNEITLACRGLILDNNFNIVARPFGKFFNLSEHQADEIPNLPFQVFDKMDGSLGILYFVEGKPFMASRGSFNSEQSIKANDMLYGKYRTAIEKLNPAYTYMFEIIYPENRIVVDYQDTEAIVLLGIIETATGNELPLENIGFPLVTEYAEYQSISELKELAWENHEGFVIRFTNGFRVKIKFEEYVRLHRILTKCSTIDIWEHLLLNKPFDELLEKVPDEFFDWVKATVKELTTQFESIENDCKTYFKVMETRKETAEYFLKHPHNGVLFNMLDGRDYSHTIWRKLRPVYEKPFAKNGEE